MTGTSHVPVSGLKRGLAVEKKVDYRDRFTVMISPRVRQAFDELTEVGFVPGRLILELLEEAVPHFERLARAARAAKEGKQTTLEEFVGETLMDMGRGVRRLGRRKRRTKAEG